MHEFIDPSTESVYRVRVDWERPLFGTPGFRAEIHRCWSMVATSSHDVPADWKLVHKTKLVHTEDNAVWLAERWLVFRTGGAHRTYTRPESQKTDELETE